MTEAHLRCPACGDRLTLPALHLFEGQTLGCHRCGEELIIAREWDKPTGDYVWILVYPASEEIEHEN